MSTSSLLSISTRALTANQSALQVVGHNIANANTVGYSRQTAVLQSAGGQFVGNGFYGKGVDVSTVERAHSDFLTRQATLAKSTDAADSVRSEQLNQLEQVFQTGASGLGAGVNNLLNAFADVANAPNDMTARTAALSQADEMSARFRTASARLDDLQSGVQVQMQGNVTAINSLASKIATLNQAITNAASQSQAPNDLLDQREQAISDLNQYVQTSVLPAQDGSLSVFIAGSQPLVLGQQASPVSLVADPQDPSQRLLAIGPASQRTTLGAAMLGGGEMAGLLQFHNDDLGEARNLLGRMALVTGQAINDQHQLGLDLNGQPGGKLFTLGSLPSAMPAASNTGNASLQASVQNATALMASDYSVEVQSGQVLVTRLTDGQQSSFAGFPVQIDGLQFQIGAGTAHVGDRFMLKPFSQAAAQISTAISAPQLLAAASPVAAQMGNGNTGNLSVANLSAQQANANLTSTVTLSFTSNGTFDVAGTGTGNPTGVAYTPGQPINYNGWSLNLKGTPQPGDTITVAANTLTTRNAGNAQSLLGLRDLVTADGNSLSDGYASLLAQVGTKVQGAQLAADVSKSMAVDAEQARSGVAGVNLDEEAAKLLQYQQAYQAAAKIIQVAQGVFDSLLQSMGR